MAVQFILGRSGTGKTSYCIKAVVNALLAGGREPLILLVPEQATYQAENAILADSRVSGYTSGTPFYDETAARWQPSLNVLSFARLQFLLLSKSTALPEISRIGRQMIIHKLLRDNVGKLKAFYSAAASPGLAQQMAVTISELHQYAKTPEDIDRLLTELTRDEHNSLAAMKFVDIALIFKEYLKSIEEKFTDPDVQLNQCRRAVGGADIVKGARLWVDGFAGFTAAELAILAELLKNVAEAQIALCLDPARLDLKNPNPSGSSQTELFSSTAKTYAELLEITRKCRLKAAEPVILEKPLRFSSCPELAHIERSIFQARPSKMPAANHIRIVSAANARAEVRFLARKIRRLVGDGNCRYRDIAVITSNVEHYQHYITAYFDDYDIPFFIDRRKLLNQHGVVELICSALQVVTGGFSGADIFSCLKTDLVGVERCEVDLLENYCLAFGIGADDWQSNDDWHFAGKSDEDFDQKQVNQIRHKASKPLLELRDRLSNGDGSPKTTGPVQFTQIVFDFLEGLKVREKLGRWIEQATKTGDYSAADEHRQFYNKLVNIFDELVEVFTDQKLTCKDYLAILKSSFSQLTLAFIPPSLDQVLVGSIERSRHPNLKAVFLIGATQSQFPMPLTPSGVLTDDDRQAAGSADFSLAATSVQKLIERQYLAYIAFTRPSEFLWITYPLLNDKGSPEMRSQFIDDLASLFDDITEESAPARQTSVESISSETQLAEFLCGWLGRDAAGDTAGASREQLDMLLDDICSDERLAEVGSNVISATSYENTAQLDSDVVETLFPKRLNSSATRLGAFAACPYQYFAGYVLDLKERREFKFEPLDVGIFYHQVLDRLARQLNTEKKDFASIADDELLGLLRAILRELRQSDSFISNFVRHSPHNAYIIDSAGEALEDCVLAIAKMVRAGSFRPMLSEVTFGRAEGRTPVLGHYEVHLADGRILSLGGKIDRLDIADIADTKPAIIFDYKRSGRSFSWSRFYHGLDMQLPIYMLAVRNASNPQYRTLDAAGAFYMPVEVTPKKVEIEELEKKTDTSEYKAKGIFNGEYAPQLDQAVQSKWSSFYNFRDTKNNGQYGDYAKSGALKPDDFDAFLRFTEKKIAELAEQILSGSIDVHPYRLGTSSACTYCKYRPVCRFDWQINDYNPLETVSKITFLETAGRADG